MRLKLSLNTLTIHAIKIFAIIIFTFQHYAQVFLFNFFINFSLESYIELKTAFDTGKIQTSLAALIVGLFETIISILFVLMIYQLKYFVSVL